MSTRRFALVDCNNFFCSCERVFNPRLLKVPIVVLSNNDGCIISRSQEAKNLGIPMGAPLHEQQEVIQKNRVHVLSSNYTLYGDMSARVMSILREEVSSVEVYSIDEAFLELPEKFDEKAASKLRAKVLRWTGIPVCIGMGTTKLLAKLSNHYAKKNPSYGGLFELENHPFSNDIMASTRTGDLWGVGKNLERRLQHLGMTTVLEFKNASPACIRKELGVVGERLLRELNGISCMNLEEIPPARKGVMASRSFGSSVESLEELEEALANHVARASERIRRFGLLASHLQVSLQTNRFKKEEPQYAPTIGHALLTPTASTSQLMNIARKMLHSIYRSGYRYKKTGIFLGGLVSEDSFQPSLFDIPVTNPRGDIDKICDAINKKLGDPKNPLITRASQGTKQSSKGWKMRSQRRSPRYTTDWRELPIARI